MELSWIGTVDRGIIHVHDGRTDTSRSDDLSGDVIFRLFEDREGNVWAAASGGLDRFRELPFTTISEKEGLSSNATQSVVAATDGSVWRCSTWSDQVEEWTDYSLP